MEPGEEMRARDFLEEIAAQQKRGADRRGIQRRGFHAKTHAGFLAEFHVLPDLPDYALQGVFKEPRVFQAAVRFSNGDFRVNEDANPEPRGIGIKLVGVPGRKLQEGEEDALTQDFLATSHSVTSTVRNARQFMAFIRAVNGIRPLLPFRLAWAVGVREAVRILKAVRTTVLRSEVHSMATERYGGTAPIQMGPYAVKFIVQPAAETEPAAGPGSTPDFLREELAERLQKGDLWFDFMLQFYVDDQHTPIEDTSIPWDTDASPPLTVARLRILSCNLKDDKVREQSEKIDELAFSPWHAIAEHQPLGSVMRARRLAYPLSAGRRPHRPEPSYLPL
ncbi:MAG TPA: hypothetical protein VEQ60_12210 [Longimicrobium sp.]|nr:hypothetical protein [Longimicrobium sp.]